MTKGANKITKRIITSRQISIIILLVIVLVSGAIFWKNSYNLSIDNNTEETSEEIKPKLEMVNYEIEPTQNGQVLLRSSNYKFQFILPSKYEFSSGRGFSKYYPEDETVAVFTLDPHVENDLTYSINIGFLNNQDINEIVNEEVEGEIRNLGYAGKTKEDGNFRVTNIVSSAGEGIKMRFIGALGGENLIYYFEKSDKYYRISINPTKSYRFTQAQLNEIEQFINSFKFLD